MVHLVDTVEVEVDHVDDYLGALRAVGIPVMTEAGASFVSCRTTSRDLGENVCIEIVWGFEDHDRWNEIRKSLVLDARFYEYGQRTAALRTGGKRRFYYPVDLDAQTL
jgi:hypothetical protein